MKKFFANIALASAAVTLVATSCAKDFLDTTPTSSVAEANIFPDVDGTLLAINGIHRIMHDCSSDWYSQGSYPTFCIHLAALSDDWIFTYQNAMFQDTQNYVHHRDLTHKYNDCNYYWKTFYKVINNANKIIYYIDDLEGDDNTRQFVKGQAFAYRAFAHFQLVQTWAERYDWTKTSNDQLGVIIRTEPSFENLPRATVEEVYAQILKDIDVAIECLGKTTYEKFNKSHIDIWAAKSIKARVLLTMGKWAEAAAVSQDVIDNSGYKLAKSTYTDTDKENRLGEMTNSEWIWGCSSSRTDMSQQGSKLRSWHDLVSNNAGSYNANSPRAINCQLYWSIPETDVRKGMWLEDPYTAKTIYLPNGGKKAPFMAQKFLVDDNTTKYVERDVPYIRLPEIMMIAAEGYAKSSQVAKAQKLVYDLGNFRDPAYTMPTESGDALMEKILWQKRVELWGEAGIRWFDLKRLNLPCDRGAKPRAEYNQGNWKNSATKAPEKLDPLASNYDMYGANLGDGARYIPAGDKRWQWLLPTQEVNTNPLCEQNPL